MESLEHKSITTRRGFTYSYYVSSVDKKQPTLLLQHGFPDDAHLWNGIARKLTNYNLIVPDLLGYGGTSKPTNVEAYSFAGMADDLVEILDAEQVEKVISVGHDFGSALAQRLYTHHPARVNGLILLAVGYMIPSLQPPNLEEQNAQLEAVFGYPVFDYQKLMVSDDAPGILRANADRLYSGMHGVPRDWMKQILCTKGALRSWLVDHDKQVELRSFAQDPDLQRRFVERYQRDGFEGPVCYYKALYDDVQYAPIRDLDKDRFIVRVPVCQITCTQDAVCRPEASIPAKQGGFLPDLEEHVVDSGHWVPLEKPDEIAELMEAFLRKRFAKH